MLAFVFWGPKALRSEVESYEELTTQHCDAKGIHLGFDTSCAEKESSFQDLNLQCIRGPYWLSYIVHMRCDTS